MEPVGGPDEGPVRPRLTCELEGCEVTFDASPNGLRRFCCRRHQLLAYGRGGVRTSIAEQPDDRREEQRRRFLGS